MPSLRKSTKSPNSGQISIYLCLIFAVMLSLIITVINTARTAALQIAFECAVENSLCSVFGEYNKELLERYNLMYIDLSYLSNSPDIKNLEMHINDYYNDNLHAESNTRLLFAKDFLDIKKINANVDEYSLATDYLGTSFINQSVSYMKNYLGVDTAEEILNKAVIFDKYEFTPEKYEKTKNDNLELIKNKEDDSWEQIELKNKIRGFVSTDDIFILLLPFGFKLTEVSRERISTSDSLLRRQKHQGNRQMPASEILNNIDPIDNIFFDEYIMDKMGNYMSPKEDTKMKYEVEYIINGDYWDYNNLSHTLERIFQIRILANILALNLAEDKMDAIKPVSEILSALLEIPEIMVTELVVLGWATLEAVVDCNDLIKGEKVSFIKKSSEIKVSISGLFEGAASNVLPGEVAEEGNKEFNFKMGYEDYLRVLLYFTPTHYKAYTTMDMIEHDMRKTSGNEYFRFDSCTDIVKVSFSMESGYDFRFLTEKKYSYF